MFLTELGIGNLIMGSIIYSLLLWCIKIGIYGFILYFIIKKACEHIPKKNADEFDYDYLAEKTAAEICRRMAIIENQKATATKSAAGSAADPNQGNRTGAPELDGSRQA